MLLASCGSSDHGKSIAHTSIPTILDNPSSFDGMLVHVSGAAVVKFEASFICPTLEALDSAASTKQCLALVPGENHGSPNDVRPLDGKTVVVVGRFNARMFGHMGAYGGSIAANSGRVTGNHKMTDGPLPPPPPSTAKRFNG